MKNVAAVDHSDCEGYHAATRVNSQQIRKMHALTDLDHALGIVYMICPMCGRVTLAYYQYYSSTYYDCTHISRYFIPKTRALLIGATQ